MSLLYFITLPLLAIFLTPLYKNHLRVVSLFLQIILLFLVVKFANHFPIVENIAFDSNLSIQFVLDRASIFFITIFISIKLLFSIYNLNEESNKAIFITTNMLLVGVLGLVLSHDIFNIYIFFEIASISAYILTSLNRDKKAYSGAIRYMIIGSIASIFLLLAIMLIYLNTGSLNLSLIAQNFDQIEKNMQFLIMLSLFVGFGIKVEIFPLNFWVAHIYEASHSKINGLFSSILSKAYIFVFFHIAYILKVPDKYMAILTLIGISSFLIAELSALNSKDVKRIFAYSTLGQLGIIFLAFSYQNELILMGAIFLFFMHSLTKLMLFFSLNLLENNLNSSKIEIFKKFKSLFLTIIFIVGFLSLLGIPPFGGFIAKLTILKGLASLEEYFMIGAILTISLIEATYLFRLLGFNMQKGEKVEIKITMLQRVVLIFIAIAILYFGLFPETLLDISNGVAKDMLKGAMDV